MRESFTGSRAMGEPSTEANMTATSTSGKAEDKYLATLEKLTTASIDNHYNVYRRFEWVDSIPDDAWWMSPELMSVHGTPVADRLDEATLKRLSKWESINFYSLNVHGIRELIVEVMRRIHSRGYEEASEFFHRFVGEENDHMWFFAYFCQKYGPKIYPDKSVKSESTGNAIAEDLLVFARIVIFEEIVDHYNMRMGKDTRLPALVQSINWVHHEDESRHISGGRQIVKRLHGELAAKNPELLPKVDEYIKRYILTSVESLYNPRMYADAGIPDPYALRRELLASPVRKAQHREVLKRIVGFLVNNSVLSESDFI
jgi:hypothetical protein